MGSIFLMRDRMTVVTALALILLVLLPGGWPLSGAQPSGARGVTIAAASDLQGVFPELQSRFERATGLTAKVSFGSSGNFFAQLQNGAPFDVFMSADIGYPERLVSAGLAEPSSLYTYGVGRIVVWTRRNSRIDVRRGVAGLNDPRVRHIAIANPEHAPYGRAAVAALKSAGVYEALKQKLVFGENISQAAQLAESGNADVGIIALALALGPALQASGTYSEIPASVHPPIEQAAVVLNAAGNKEAARQFIAYLKNTDTLDLFQRFGFAPPAERMLKK
jgi:molybdate transport system substrate-binding protein